MIGKLFLEMSLIRRILNKFNHRLGLIMLPTIYFRKSSSCLIRKQVALGDVLLRASQLSACILEIENAFIASMGHHVRAFPILTRHLIFKTQLRPFQIFVMRVTAYLRQYIILALSMCYT